VRRPTDGEVPVHSVAATLASAVVPIPGPAAAWRAVRRMLRRRPMATARALAWALRVRVGERGALRAFADGCWLAAGPARRADHIHAHFAHGSATAALVAGRLAGRPASFTGHADDLTAAVPGWVLSLKTREAALAVTVCDTTCRYLRSVVADRDAPKVAAVPNGVDTTLFAARDREPEGEPVVLTIGRLVDKKGVDVVVRAAACSDPRIHWEVIGEGPRRAGLERLAASLGAESRIRFLRARDQAEVRDALGRAAVLACPSRHVRDRADALPMVLLEAMSVGVPVVATPVQGIPEVVTDGVSGLLVPADDPAALAGAVQALLSDPSLRARLVAGGRRVVADRDVDTTAGLLRRLLVREAATSGID
jgi:colanic acid/amylovoran biosynthesis glycosyltransferase